MNSLSECKAAGVPIYSFGSPELAQLHEASRNPPVRVGTGGDGWVMSGSAWRALVTYPVYSQVYGEHADGRQYVVNHGGFFTLNTLHAGQVCPSMQDIAPH